MGLESPARVTFGEAYSQGKALLETSELIFRGDFRLEIPFKEIQELRAEDGVLVVRFPEGEARFEIGPLAARWAEKIRNPPGRLDKLGVKAGSMVRLDGVQDAAFREEILTRGGQICEQAGPEGLDLIFIAASAPADLHRLPELRAQVGPKGAIWVVSPKGKGAPLKDTEIMAAARAAGLVDTKVAAFSGSHTALKLVIPVAKRDRATGTAAGK
jgi:hypothetical protein